MAMMLLFIILFSAFYIAAEAGHDCCGEDCHICACIRLCKNTLRGVSEGTPALAVCIAFIAALIPAAFIITETAKDTPVSDKVRLNN